MPDTSDGQPGEPRNGRLHGALRNSFIEGAFSAFTGAIVDNFAIFAILLLGARERDVGTFTGLAALLCAVAHLVSPRLTALAPSRRTLVVRCVRLQSLTCLGFGLAGYLGLIDKTLALYAAIGAYALMGAFGNTSNGPWASWMSDLVPRPSRGKYFAWRGRWLGLIVGVIALASSFALDRLKKDGQSAVPWTAFALLFAAAAVTRFVSSCFLARQYEPPMREKFPLEDFSYRQFLSKAGRSNFATYTVALAALWGAASLTGPFLMTYLKQDLHYSYATCVVLAIVALASSLVMLPFWGRVADRWGNLLVIRICALSLSFIPLVYIGQPRYWLFVVGWLIGGMTWAGLGMASFNFVMEAATPLRRVRCFAYMNATVLFSVALFAFSGGFLAEHLPPLYGYRMQSLFLLSVGLRLVPAVFLVLAVKEIGSRPPAEAMDLLLELPAVRPAFGFLRSVGWPFSRP